MRVFIFYLSNLSKRCFRTFFCRLCDCQQVYLKTEILGELGPMGWVHTITKKHYIPESTSNYQKALRKHMQGGVGMPCLLLSYVCWIIKMYTGGKNRYMILKRD